MTLDVPLAGIRVILLDIEGTTTPIAFVHERLFSYAREQLDQYLLDAFRTSPVVQDAVHRLAERTRRPTAAPRLCRRGATTRRRICAQSVAAYVRWLMDRDRKSPGLKLLQGVIWEARLSGGRTPRRGVRRRAAGASAMARRGARRRDLLVRAASWRNGGCLPRPHHGDFTPLIAGFFDTAVGGKTVADSYRRIAERAGLPTRRTCCSCPTSTAELAAAAEAGCQVRLCAAAGQCRAARCRPLRADLELR